MELEQQVQFDGLHVQLVHEELAAKDHDVVEEDDRDGLGEVGQKGFVWCEGEVIGGISCDQAEEVVENRPQLDTKRMCW